MPRPNYGNRIVSDPTPAQIKKNCAKIQEKWSEEERIKRARHLIAPPVEIKTASPVWNDLILDQTNHI